MFSTLGANTPLDATTPETGGMIQKYKITKLNPFSTNASISFLLKTSNFRSSDAFRGCKSGGLFH